MQSFEWWILCLRQMRKRQLALLNLEDGKTFRVFRHKLSATQIVV